MSVYGTDALVYTEAFLGCLFKKSALAEASTSPCGTVTFSRRLFSQPASLQIKFRRRRNIDLLSIVYALRPRLRIRLTLGGRTFPRKPWVYGDPGLNRVYRYSCLHSHFRTLHGQFPFRFDAYRTLPYHEIPANRYFIRSFGRPLDRQSFSARDLSMSQLLRFV